MGSYPIFIVPDEERTYARVVCFLSRRAESTGFDKHHDLRARVQERWHRRARDQGSGLCWGKKDRGG